MSVSDMQLMAGIAFLILVAALVGFTFFTAALYGAINPNDPSVNGGQSGNVAGAAGSIILFTLKRKLKRVIFRHLI